MKRSATRLLGPPLATVAAVVTYTLACPPYEISATAWLVPGLLLTGTRRLPPATAALYGLAFAVAVGIGVTGWARDAAMTYFGLGAPAATAFVAAVWLVFGLPYAALCACYARLGRRMAPGLRPLAGAWLWAVTDVVRGSLVAGVPWELLGHTQYQALWLIQIADLGGVGAVSFVIAFVSVSVAETFHDWDSRPNAGTLAIQRLLPAIVLLMAAMVYGFHGRLQHGAHDGMVSRRVAVVQGTVPRHQRWLDGPGATELANYASITRRMHDQHLDLVVWPEHAVDGEHEPLLRRRLASVAAEVGEPLLVGARHPVPAGGVRDAAYLLDASGALREMSDEIDPVPVAAVAAVAATRVDHDGSAHVAGVPRTLPTPAFPIGATSRRELVRPEVARELVGQGADLLVSLGGDDPAVPSMHGDTTARDLTLAVFRAVETRRYLVRAAGAGPSGFVDPTGELYAMIDAGRSGATVGRVSPRSDLTPYVRFGDVWLLVVGLAVGATLLAEPPRSVA